MMEFRDLGKHTKYPIAGAKTTEPEKKDKPPVNQKPTSISAEDAAALLNKKGWIEIHSKDLDCNFYILRRPRKGSLDEVPQPPNPPDLPRYYLEEIQHLEGLAKGELSLMHDQKAILGGTFIETWEKVTIDGKEEAWILNGQKAPTGSSPKEKRKVFKQRKKHFKDACDYKKKEWHDRLEKFAIDKETFLAKKEGRPFSDKNINRHWLPRETGQTENHMKE